MTGLDVEKDVILEIACIVTESDLTVVDECGGLVIHQDYDTMIAMNDWCKDQHKRSGLIKDVEDSKLTLQDAELKILDFLKEHTLEKKSPLAGNSIYMDKIFLMKYMPKICEHLHYRLIDVSTLTELSKRWTPEILLMSPKKSDNHRACGDIQRSVELLKYFKKNIFPLSVNV